MIFTPVSREGPYETIGYCDLVMRCALAIAGPDATKHDAVESFSPEAREWEAIWEAVAKAVQGALQQGKLLAHVYVSDERMFYRVPDGHWNKSAGVEGSPLDTLFCWSTSDVPAKFHDLPLLFFVDEVDRWERGLVLHVDQRLRDGVVFERYLTGAGNPRAGRWSIWATLAWVISRDDKFTAAVQAFEKAEQARTRSAGAWAVLSVETLERFGKTLDDALVDLLALLDDDTVPGGRLPGGRATDASGKGRKPESWEWGAPDDWRHDSTWPIHDRYGLGLGPNLYNPEWPSTAVRAAFPATDAPAETTEVSAVGQLPPSAKPNDRLFKPVADRAAELVRKGPCGIAKAIRFALEELGNPSPHSTPESNQRAARAAYSLMYDQGGQPHPK